MKTLAIITARGGSKGLPDKNIKLLLGKPLIAWTIESALKTKEIDKVIVSTDSKKIADISLSFGAEVPFIRPPELSCDSASSLDVLIHAVNFCIAKNEHYDLIVLLEPTSPLRKKNDLSNAIKSFYSFFDKYEGIVSLGEVHLENPFIVKTIDENNLVLPLIDTKTKITQRQQYPKAYFPYGVIYAVKTDVLIKYRRIYSENSMPYLIERWQNYEIDDIYDFLCVETILKNKLTDIV
jgi:CMP-N-acetylneuraminic acid synthetase